MFGRDINHFAIAFIKVVKSGTDNRILFANSLANLIMRTTVKKVHIYGTFKCFAYDI